MRPRLMTRLLEPNKLDLSPRALTLTHPEAHALAAICMKTAHPEVFPQSLSGESVRLALQYHEQMEKQWIAERPHYDRV
jgi:hypothetical protein